MARILFIKNWNKEMHIKGIRDVSRSIVIILKYKNKYFLNSSESYIKD
jgi:hypothetical protein